MAKSRFQSFVVFAEMRTGSNFLEANLNAIPGVTCHGEAFNPAFIGNEKKQELLGVSIHQRKPESPAVCFFIAFRKASGFWLR